MKLEETESRLLAETRGTLLLVTVASLKLRGPEGSCVMLKEREAQAQAGLGLSAGAN